MRCGTAACATCGPRPTPPLLCASAPAWLRAPPDGRTARSDAAHCDDWDLVSGQGGGLTIEQVCTHHLRYLFGVGNSSDAHTSVLGQGTPSRCGGCLG
eukprot:scaffold1033_cov408-Prasinococcus_capsulatus_cf.AAC.21